MPSRRPFGPPSARQKDVLLNEPLTHYSQTFADDTYLVDDSLADIDCTEQKSVDAEEDIVGVDRVDTIGVGL